MSSDDRERPDDPATRERETQRLARDEYDRPRYGSPQSAAGAAEPQRGPHTTSRYVEENPGASQRAKLDDVRAEEIMTRRVGSVQPTTSVERAARLMEEGDCGGLPVVGDNGVLVGMVTDRDIVLRVVARGRDARNAVVADCMTERVVACYGEESIAECMRQMAQHQVRRLPIVDERGHLVGILAQGDLAQHARRHSQDEGHRALTNVVAAVSQPALPRRS